MLATFTPWLVRPATRTLTREVQAGTALPDELLRVVLGYSTAWFKATVLFTDTDVCWEGTLGTGRAQFIDTVVDGIPGHGRRSIPQLLKIINWQDARHVVVKDEFGTIVRNERDFRWHLTSSKTPPVRMKLSAEPSSFTDWCVERLAPCVMLAAWLSAMWFTGQQEPKYQLGGLVLTGATAMLQSLFEFGW